MRFVKIGNLWVRQVGEFWFIRLYSNCSSWHEVFRKRKKLRKILVALHNQNGNLTESERKKQKTPLLSIKFFPLFHRLFREIIMRQPNCYRYLLLFLFKQYFFLPFSFSCHFLLFRSIFLCRQISVSWS